MLISPSMTFSTSQASNSGLDSCHSSTRSTSSGAVREKNDTSRWCCCSSSTIAFSKSALKMSRTTRTDRSASWKTIAGAAVSATRFSSTSCSLKRYCSSRSKSWRLAPCAAVRTIAPPPCRSRPLASRRRRSRSLSSRRLETPTPSPVGVYTMYRPAIVRSIDSRAPLVFKGSLTTWTTTSWPGLSSSQIDLPLELTRPRRATSTPGMTISSTCRKPFLSSPMSTNAASSPGRTLSTLPL